MIEKDRLKAIKQQMLNSSGTKYVVAPIMINHNSGYLKPYPSQRAAVSVSIELNRINGKGYKIMTEYDYYRAVYDKLKAEMAHR